MDEINEWRKLSEGLHFFGKVLKMVLKNIKSAGSADTWRYPGGACQISDLIAVQYGSLTSVVEANHNILTAGTYSYFIFWFLFDLYCDSNNIIWFELTLIFFNWFCFLQSFNKFSLVNPCYLFCCIIYILYHY